MHAPIYYAYHYMLTPKARKVADILQRDGGITHMTAFHYGIGSITKEIARLRVCLRPGHDIVTEKRKDINGYKYTRWTLVKKEAR